MIFEKYKLLTAVILANCKHNNVIPMNDNDICHQYNETRLLSVVFFKIDFAIEIETVRIKSCSWQQQQSREWYNFVGDFILEYE